MVSYRQNGEPILVSLECGISPTKITKIRLKMLNPKILQSVPDNQLYLSSLPFQCHQWLSTILSLLNILGLHCPSIYQVAVIHSHSFKDAQEQVNASCENRYWSTVSKWPQHMVCTIGDESTHNHELNVDQGLCCRKLNRFQGQGQAKPVQSCESFLENVGQLDRMTQPPRTINKELEHIWLKELGAIWSRTPTETWSKRVHLAHLILPVEDSFLPFCIWLE